jgi:two-component system, cell cycle sensor histidine kinase and response regulator CckA
MKKILLVDNDRFILEVVKDLLTNEGYQVLTAEDGLSALDALEGFTPDAIFVDMIMPNIDGKRLCRILRKMENLKETCIFSLSATALEDLGDIEALGVTASIAKGPLEQMANQILGVLGKSSTIPGQPAEGKTLRSDVIRQRGITRELLSSMKHFEIILEQMDEGILESASDGRIVYANRGACVLAGLPEEDILGRHFPNLFAKDDRVRIWELFRTGRETAKRASGEHPLTLNGYLVTMDVHPIPGCDAKVIVILNNVSDQKRAERALKKSEEQYRLLFENANDAIFVIQGGLIKFPNRRAVELFGMDSGNRTEVAFLDRVHPEERNTVNEKYQRALEGEAFPGAYAFRIVNPAHEELWVELNAVPIRWEERPAMLNFLRDVTEKRRLEAHFQQSQRMASIGTLAGGIAHEFNNLLMVIQANASLILYKRDPGGPEYERLKNIEAFVQKGAELTRHLLAFAREEKHRPEPTNLNELVKRTEELFVRSRKKITVHSIYQEDILTVEVDPVQIEQVLMSLYLNAWQAMPGGGEVFLETKNTRLGSEFVRAYGVEPGRYVSISVRDTGVGMDDKTRERIFDPFFTTKTVGQGVGLGLAAAYGIIRNHGGIMDVSSVKGEGSTFSIYLPASKQPVPEERDENRTQGRRS